MKKVLLITGAILFLGLPSFGQAVCTPDPQYTNTTTQKGIHPDTIVNLAPAYVSTPYAQTLTIVVPPDTSVFPFTFTWDSTVLVSASGLPPGFSYACWNNNGFGDPNRCKWKGNSIGCAKITGTPALSDTGTHNLVFQTISYGAWPGSPSSFTVTGYKIIVNNTTAVSENSKVQALLQNSPNPFGDKSEIQFIAEESGIVQLKIYNMIGIIIEQDNFKVKKGINRIEMDAKNFDSGIYFYSILDNYNTFTRKMIVNK